MSLHQTVRRWILTGSVAAITVTGTYYGARLKAEREVVVKQRELRELSPANRIEQLEHARAEAEHKMNELVRKVERFRERRREEELARRGPE